MTTRYGRPAFVGVFALLLLFAALTLFLAAPLMSNACFDASGQIACPVDGPDWIRPVPAAAAVLGLLTGLAGVTVGRSARKPALIAGFTLIAAGLAINAVVN
ncbi:hypothetical protein [Paractinoplanes lichenicola]|uniref:Uncharacterized protein n=1 Tax=Paractinoplanes lichenicola TaxID=2802976 RepID=A0ABS1VWT6_9ACTN|nr:hypothetical protein [Actinoplanes lichenicola]MBL7258947.1 hypothetical protein [Actinoplanes lichenicola]